MGEDSKTIVGSVARGLASIEDTGEETDVVAGATGRWTPETTTPPRDKARWHVLGMVDQARRAAENERVDDARWWRERATCAPVEHELARQAGSLWTEPA